MKEDVERREKAQAEVISQQVRWLGDVACSWVPLAGLLRALSLSCPWSVCNALLTPARHLPPVTSEQAKRLEELDALYRDEAILRKKIFNQVRGCSCGQVHELGKHARRCWVCCCIPFSIPLGLPPVPDPRCTPPPQPATHRTDGGHEGQDPGVLPCAPGAADGAGPRAAGCDPVVWWDSTMPGCACCVASCAFGWPTWCCCHHTTRLLLLTSLSRLRSHPLEQRRS